MTTADATWLLDTSVLVNVLRDTPLGRHLVEQQQLRARIVAPLLSVVSVGELLSLGRQLGWGETKLARMQELVSELVIIDINNDVVLNSYAEIDAWCRQNGFRPGKNDLWIAASAVAANATLLTADKDFDPLHERFLERVFFDPDGEYPTA
ncbi:MAG: type II toxin-antitoxin system VapC family toxin [Deltaproteobacteria bacterium]|nr:type II toxin-antitoxin system VapC family toxin [Deltaproteobacteria bacterium]